MERAEIIKALECCSTREGDCENCPLDKATTMNCQWVLLSLCLDVIKEQQEEIERLKLGKAGAESGAMEAIKELQAHNENLKKENKYLRERLAEEAEIKEDMKGK